MILSVRTGRLVALASWSALLLWLWVDDQIPRYLGPRTAWIVPVGGTALTLATMAYARWTADASVAHARLHRREAAGLAALLAPALVMLCLANATLGSLAAANKLSSRGVDLSRLASSLVKGSAKVDFLVIHVAESDPAVARGRGIVPGRPVSLTGFVMTSASAAPGHPFKLARLYITCCVADSVAMAVPIYPVHPDTPYRKDQWLQVSGVLARHGKQFVVEQAVVKPVPQPKKPYGVFRV